MNIKEHIIDPDIQTMNVIELDLEFRKQVDVCAALQPEDKRELVQILRSWASRTLQKAE